jgi:hypothetical protein
MTKCKGLHCPKKEKCKRYTSPPNAKQQEYFARIPFIADYCRFYIHVEPIAPDETKPAEEKAPELKRAIRKPKSRKPKKTRA